jgi:hypothetical protein
VSFYFSKKETKVICLSWMLGLYSIASPRSIDIFVSPQGNDTNAGSSLKAPFATLKKAQLYVREVKKTKQHIPVDVYLTEGVYYLNEPLVFSSADMACADAPVTWRPYKNKRVVISGGRKVTGWKKYKDNIWVTEIPEAKNGNWKFRQIFVNGKVSQRAKIPNSGFYRVTGFPDGGLEIGYHTNSVRFEYKPGDINSNWVNLEDIEVVAYHFWTDSHLRIKLIDTVTHIVIFKYPSTKVFTDDFTDDGARYVIENVFESLDAPGEWYLNSITGMLYYIPLDNENIADVDVIAPKISELIKFEGDIDKQGFVENVHFKGLVFMHNNWDLPEGNTNDAQASSTIPGAIRFTGTKNCSFDECEITNVGTFAFEIGGGCSNITISNCSIHYVAAGAVRMNGGTDRTKTFECTGNNNIVHNNIFSYGQVYPSAAGILLMHTYNNLVANNQISYGHFTGISIGWEWGYGPSVSVNNIVENNYVHHIGQGLLSDMGGIYTLGVSPGTVLRNNVIHDIDANRYGGWGIYNDEGSSEILVENNVVYNTRSGGYNLHYGNNNVIINNIFAFGRDAQINIGKVEPHKAFTFKHNIVYWTQGPLFGGACGESLENKLKCRPSYSGIDSNCYFNSGMDGTKLGSNKYSLEEWRALGNDTHSLYKNPMFKKPENHDFILKSKSPVFALGFKASNIQKTKSGR